MSVTEKEMVKDILEDNPVLSKDDEKFLKEIDDLLTEWADLVEESEKDDFKPNKEDWEGLPTEKQYTKLPTTEEYMGMIGDALVSKGYLSKSEDDEESEEEYEDTDDKVVENNLSSKNYDDLIELANIIDKK